MQRYAIRNNFESFRKENKGSTNIYTSAIKSKRKTTQKHREKERNTFRGYSGIPTVDSLPPKEGYENIASSDHLYDSNLVSVSEDEEVLEEQILSQALAERCVPMELRPYFRSLSEMDRELRPRNYKVIQDVFAKCRLCVFEESRKKFSPLEWATEVPIPGAEEGDDSSEPQECPVKCVEDHVCMAWIKKNKSLNTNMYFCFHGKNILVRRILFEWFVGPTRLTEKEKEAFQKKRSRNRKKPRRIHPSCSFPECIMPNHLGATPPLPEYLRTKPYGSVHTGEDSDSGSTHSKDRIKYIEPSTAEHDVLGKTLNIRKHKHEDVLGKLEEVVNGNTIQMLARDGLWGANKWSTTILERMEMEHCPRKHKRKRLKKSWRKSKISKYGNVGLDNKLVGPLLYTKERLNGYV